MAKLSPLLFIAVMQGAMKEARRKGLKELLYADDLVLIVESEEEGVEKFNAWKKRAEGEHGKDKGYDIWRGTDDKNGEWEISMWMLWKRDGREFSVV